MKSAFILHHSYELNACEETKSIGVYTSKEKAQATIERLKMKNGFRDRPNDFSIDEYELDKDHWTDGFTTVYHREVD